MPPHPFTPDQPLHFEQRRISQLSSVLVRNLSLHPNRDRALRSLELPSSRSKKRVSQESSVDDADLALELSRKSSRGKERSRRRSSSWARASGSDDGTSASEDDQSRRSRRRGASPGVLIDTKGKRRSSSIHRSSELETNDSPRPILKRNASAREGRLLSTNGLSPPSSLALPSDKQSLPFLSRSDSTRSIGSDGTVTGQSPASSERFRPGGRPRTQSSTSVSTVRSVRFDTQVSAIDPPRPGHALGSKFSTFSSPLFDRKDLKSIMQDRLLDCYVEIRPDGASAPGESAEPEAMEARPSGTRFYRTSISRAGLNHTWGSLQGPPICPERDLQFGGGSDKDIGKEKWEVPGINSSSLVVRIWARKGPLVPLSRIEKDDSNAFVSEGATSEETWKMVSSRLVDLRELERLDSDLSDPQNSFPPNTLIFGLSMGDCVTFAKSFKQQDQGLPDVPATTEAGREQRSEESQKGNRPRIAEQVVYYIVPNDAGWQGLPQSARGKEGGRLSPLQKRVVATESHGYASDPEAFPSRPDKVGKGTDRRRAFQTEKRLALELSMRETKMMKSYTLDQARSILKLQASINTVKTEIHMIEQRCNASMDNPDGRMKMSLMRNERKAVIKRLLEARRLEESDLEKVSKACEDKRNELKERRRKLEMARRALSRDESALEDLRFRNERTQRKTGILASKIHSRHVQLLRDLEAVYPIELVDASTLLFSIAGIPLPNGALTSNASDPETGDAREKSAKGSATVGDPNLPEGMTTRHTLDDDTVSSALGLVAQLVIFLSSYLGTSIHYPMATAGSRAVVQDGISLMSGPRAFPLYAKGVERYRYEYAVFLLNKNIEQLMNIHNVAVLDIRHTLPNLKNLIVTLSVAPPDRSSSTSKSGEATASNSRRDHVSEPTPLVEDAQETRETSAKELEDDFRLNAQVNSLPGAETASSSASVSTITKNGRVKSPLTSDLAIESISRALSFFGSGGRKAAHST
ncbi:hypothetical protein IE53DRAFT_367764 [Violaceomyces palustris]|uniref:Uncharacterized protein n=1 Tax=Violaceomyces palustris TaxID=1673888 RepID=A0ACD0P191_9BASI|nr:hypothetical protein IE53DRAFT_367764 [Violaceomyces palustris]